MCARVTDSHGQRVAASSWAGYGDRNAAHGREGDDGRCSCASRRAEETDVVVRYKPEANTSITATVDVTVETLAPLRDFVAEKVITLDDSIYIELADCVPGEVEQKKPDRELTWSCATNVRRVRSPSTRRKVAMQRLVRKVRHVKRKTSHFRQGIGDIRRHYPTVRDGG